MDQIHKTLLCDEITRNMNDCIVIPTYNEIENIESIIRSVLSQHKFHILIVDDNSPDRTADRVRLLQTEFSGRLFLK
jgi:dolichol-phosphate mannosyltransferase